MQHLARGLDVVKRLQVLLGLGHELGLACVLLRDAGVLLGVAHDGGVHHLLFQLRVRRDEPFELLSHLSLPWVVAARRGGAWRSATEVFSVVRIPPTRDFYSRRWQCTRHTRASGRRPRGQPTVRNCSHKREHAGATGGDTWQTSASQTTRKARRAPRGTCRARARPRTRGPRRTPRPRAWTPSPRRSELPSGRSHGSCRAIDAGTGEKDASLPPAPPTRTAPSPASAVGNPAARALRQLAATARPPPGNGGRGRGGRPSRRGRHHRDGRPEPEPPEPWQGGARCAFQRAAAQTRGGAFDSTEALVAKSASGQSVSIKNGTVTARARIRYSNGSVTATVPVRLTYVRDTKGNWLLESTRKSGGGLLRGQHGRGHIAHPRGRGRDPGAGRRRGQLKLLRKVARVALQGRKARGQQGKVRPQADPHRDATPERVQGLRHALVHRDRAL